MLEPLKKHPLVYGILLVCFFLFWVFPPWLASVWPLFSQEPFPQWLAHKGWSGMSPYLSAALLVIATVSTLGLLSAILYAVRQHRQEIGWLETVAQDDLLNLTVRIDINSSSAQTFPHLEESEPYVDFHVDLLNVSVFTLALTEIEGKIEVDGKPLQHPLELLRKNLGLKDGLKHAQVRTLTLRQWLLPETSQLFLSKKEEVYWTTGRVALWFTYTNLSGTRDQVRVAFPEILFPPALAPVLTLKG